MLKIEQNKVNDIYVSSTRFNEEGEYVFFATQGTVTQTIQLPLHRVGHTLRYDKYQLDFTEMDLVRGLWDYVILNSGSYDGNYTDVILKNKEDIVEYGKMLVVSDAPPTVAQTYSTPSSTRKQYEPN